MLAVLFFGSSALLFVGHRLRRTERAVRDQIKQAAALAELEARRRMLAVREHCDVIASPVLVEPRCAGNASLPGGWY